MNISEIESYETILKKQPLYCGKFYADSIDCARYLKVPDWVQRWMEELDKLYDESFKQAA